MGVITDSEYDNMKVEAELRVRKLFEEYRIRAQGDRLEGVSYGETKGKIQNPSAGRPRYGSREQALTGNTPVIRAETGGGESEIRGATPPMGV